MTKRHSLTARQSRNKSHDNSTLKVFDIRVLLSFYISVFVRPVVSVSLFLRSRTLRDKKGRAN